MDSEELQQAHSPRVQVELEAELGQFDPQDGFEFNEGDNPFSYYHEENHRDQLSSEDEAAPAARPEEKQPHSPSSTQQFKELAVVAPDLPFKGVEIPPNLSQKPPIPLLSSPRAIPKAPASTSSPGPSLNMFKEAEFNLGALSFKQEPKPRPQPATERAYNSELESDMDDLKRKFLARDVKKKDGKKEVHLNRTFAPAVRKQKGEPTIEFEEMRMLMKMSFQKKKANYEMLKEWDRRRAQTLALHGRLIEILQNEVDLRIKSSLENFQYYQTFFREKAKQEQKYSQSPVINTRYALQNNSLSKNVYINCSVILNSLCDENTNRCQKINDFVQLIRNNILRQLTENHLSSSQRQLLKVREKISSLKSNLKKYNSETEERANQLASLFSQQSINIKHHHQKDFFRTQLSFLRKALQQIEVQRKLGQYCLEYYHTAVQQQLKRSQVIRQAMMTYSRGLKATYALQSPAQSVEIEQMSKQEEIKLIEEFFNLDEMFDSRTSELFKAKNGLPQGSDITIDSFTLYISQFNFQPFDPRVLLLKEFQVKYLTGKGKDAQQQPCYLVITVDNFLHLFLNATRDSRTKPDITIPILAKVLELKPGRDQHLELVKKEERRGSMMSYFWDNRADKTYRLRFSKKDNREEFSDYIAKLMVEQF